MKFAIFCLKIKLFFNKIVLFYYQTFFGYFKGKNVHLIGNIKIDYRVAIGDNSTITSGSVGKVEIQRNCSLGRGLWLGAGNGSILIKNECLFGPNVTIVSQNHANSHYINFSNCLPWERDSTTYDTVIGQRCHIGANVVVLPGVILGDYCTVGANSVLKGSYESGSLIVGNPARVVKSFNIDLNICERIVSSFPPHRHLSSKFF
jgi:acetyltransferase-like isoleucine patch superfamily enzyme